MAFTKTSVGLTKPRTVDPQKKCAGCGAKDNLHVAAAGIPTGTPAQSNHAYICSKCLEQVSKDTQ